MRANVNEILVTDDDVIRGRSKGDYSCSDISGWKTVYCAPSIGQYYLYNQRAAGDERHRLFYMRAVPGGCSDLHREEVRVKEYGGMVA
jgi:hypothetical protein